MALTIASLATTLPTTDPTTELQQALTDFKQILSDDQKKHYQLLSMKPGTESATLFIANIAAKNQGAHGRFLWKRLCPFLQATQQFVRIVDTFVSSNPAVAALVWGGVRTTILAAGNASSYFDQVTGMLMEIGKLSPTFDQYGQLYINNSRVQAALCKFYTIVVRLCAKVVMNSQRGISSHVLSTFFSPFESDFKPLLDELTKAAEECRDHFSLAAQQTVAEASKLLQYESKENQAHRRRASMFRSEVRKEHQTIEELRKKRLQLRVQKTRDKIRNKLSAVDYLKAWRLALLPRVPGTAESFQSNDDFLAWKSKDSSSLLWCSGTMGVGKTVFVSNLIAHLFQHKAQDDVVAFHLCRSDQETSLSARGILGTIIRQLLDPMVQNAESDVLESLSSRISSLDGQDVVDLVLPLLEKDKKYYIVIDGLDECETAEVQILRDAIVKLYRTHTATVKLLCSGRPELESSLFSPNTPEYKISLTRPKVQDDIDKYIEFSLDECLESGKLKLSDPTLILKISQALKEGADGMFLWARFFIGEICACLSDHEIIQALDQPPRGLTKLLATILQRIKHDNAVEHVKRSLQLCFVAKRPLTCNELQEALGVHQGQKSLERDKMPTDMSRVFAGCRGLLFLDEVDDTIHYVHHSLRSYLFGTENTILTDLQELSSDILLGIVCLTYLHFNDFQQQIVKTQSSTQIKINPLDIGITSVVSPGKFSTRVARTLLRHQPQLHKLSTSEMSRKTQEILGNSEAARLQQEIHSRRYHFLEYAKVHWIDHFKNSVLVGCPSLNSLKIEDHELCKDVEAWQSLTEKQFSLAKLHRDFTEAVYGSNSLVHRPWFEYSPGMSGFEQDSAAIKALQWAVHKNHTALFILELNTHHILSSQSAVGPVILQDPPTATIRGRLASLIAHERQGRLIACMTALMIQRGWSSRMIAETNHDMFSDPVLLALTSGHSRTFSMLRAYDVISPRILQDINVLSSACEHGYSGIVDELLKAGCDPNGSILWVNRKTDPKIPIAVAVEKGSAEVAQALLDTGANPNLLASLPVIGHPLSIAVEKEDLEIVDKLLAAGAFPNVDTNSGTPLFRAVELNSAAILRRLLDGGASPHLSHSKGLPVEAAIRNRNRKIVEILLQANPVLPPDVTSSRLLIMAIESGRVDIVATILELEYPEKFSDVSAALVKAVSQDQFMVVERVLQEIPPLVFAHMIYLLDVAVDYDRPKMVRSLVCDRSEIPSRALCRHLTTATKLSRLEIAKALIEAGVDVHGDDEYSPMMTAIENNRVDMVKLLIKADATIAEADHNGVPFTVSAINQGLYRIFELLFEAGPVRSLSQIEHDALGRTATGLNVRSRLNVKGYLPYLVNTLQS